MRKMLYDPKNPRHFIKTGTEMENVYQFIVNNPGCTLHDWPYKTESWAASDLYNRGIISRLPTGFENGYMMWAYEPTETEIKEARERAILKHKSKAQLTMPTEIPTTQPKIGARQIKGHIAEIKKEVEDLLERLSKFQAIMEASYPDPKE